MKDTNLTDQNSQTPTSEDFAAMLAECDDDVREGRVVTGKVIAIENDLAIIDVGLKTEGRVPLKEFGSEARNGGLIVNDQVEVFLERVENALNEAILSREKAQREENWQKLEKAFAANEKVEGQIFNQIKGGFAVDLDGATAFLPRSQVDVRPIRDATALMNIPQPFQILKMDRQRGNIVISRRAVLEETRAEQRSELIQSLKEGSITEGIVKNITDYGAFIDLGGIDGLLHVTDIAWRRVNHPSEALSVGLAIKVKVIKVNQETNRISLGMKQLEPDPWQGVAERYKIGDRVTGRVTNITDYGAFIELEPGVEGLVHSSEMSWSKRNINPGKILSTSQQIEVAVLDVNAPRRRVSLGLKQIGENPWEAFAEKFSVGSVVEGTVKNKTEFGLFIGLETDIDGMIHLSDLDPSRPGERALEEYNRGDVVQAQVLEIDIAKERISLGIKQLQSAAMTASGLHKGSIVTTEITGVKDGGIEVKIPDLDMTSFIKRSELSLDRLEQRPERFAVGDKVDAKITQFDKRHQRIVLSIKALEAREERDAIAQYGSADSGASLGDILGAALKAQKDDDEDSNSNKT